MRKNDIKERSAGLELIRERDKYIQGYIKSGLTLESATELVDTDLVKQGRLKA
jgi:hypothetical protein